jgi:hypothetical protein
MNLAVVRVPEPVTDKTVAVAVARMVHGALYAQNGVPIIVYAIKNRAFVRNVLMAFGVLTAIFNVTVNVD